MAEIEYGVPIPAEGLRGPRGPRSRGGKIAAEMKVGASYFFENRSEWATARGYLRNKGFKTITRKREENGVRGWRLWRTT